MTTLEFASKQLKRISAELDCLSVLIPVQLANREGEFRKWLAGRETTPDWSDDFFRAAKDGRLPAFISSKLESLRSDRDVVQRVIASQKRSLARARR